jgi:hypothetical protein
MDGRLAAGGRESRAAVHGMDGSGAWLRVGGKGAERQQREVRGVRDL